MPSGKDVVVILSALVTIGAFTEIRKVVFADLAVGVVESVTAIATDAAPTEPCAGLPEITPVDLLIDNPLGRPLAPYL